MEDAVRNERRPEHSAAPEASLTGDDQREQDSVGGALPCSGGLHLRQPPKAKVSGGVGGLLFFVAARRWQRAPAHTRRSVRSGTLAADARNAAAVEPVARGTPPRQGVAGGLDDLVTIGTGEGRTECPATAVAPPARERRRDTCPSMERAAAVFSLARRVEFFVRQREMAVQSNIS